MARGCWANFPAAAADAGLEAQKQQLLVARSRRCHHERCVALAHAYAGRTRAQRASGEDWCMTLGASFLGTFGVGSEH